MLYFLVFVKRILRLPAAPSLSRILVPPPLSPKSHGVNVFADPHPLTPIASMFYKNIGVGATASLACSALRGEGASTFHSRSPLSYPLSPCPSKPFRMNTCKSVSKQRTLTPFRMNTYEKMGGGGVLLLTRNPTRIPVLRSIATKDLSSFATKDFYPACPDLVGEGASRPRNLSSFPMKSVCPERPSVGKGLSSPYILTSLLPYVITSASPSASTTDRCPLSLPSFSRPTRKPARISPRCWRSSSYPSSSPGSFALPSASASAHSFSGRSTSLPNPAPWTALPRPCREPVRTTLLRHAQCWILSGPASPSSPPSCSSITSSDPSISSPSISFSAWASPDGFGISPFVSPMQLRDEPRSFAFLASRHLDFQLRSLHPGRICGTIFRSLPALRRFDLQLTTYNSQLRSLHPGRICGTFFSSLPRPSSPFAAPLLASTTTPACTERRPSAGSSPTRWSPASAM